MVVRNFTRGKSCLSNELVLVNEHVKIIIRNISDIHTDQNVTSCVKKVPRPVNPASWRWTCHQCDIRYSLAVTSRCLNDGHTFCSGHVVNKRTGATIKSKSCGSTFDYEGWERWDTWRGKLEGLAESDELTSPTSPSPPPTPSKADMPDRDCYSRCRFPSECRWGARPGSLPKRPLIRKRKATTPLLRSPTSPSDPSVVVKQGVRKSSISSELTHEFNKKIRLTIDSTETTRITRRKSSGSPTLTSPERILTERTTTTSIAAAARRGLIVKSRKTKFKLLKPPTGRPTSTTKTATILERFMFPSDKKVKKVDSTTTDSVDIVLATRPARSMRSFFGSSKPPSLNLSLDKVDKADKVEPSPEPEQDAMDLDGEVEADKISEKAEVEEAHPGTQLLFPLLSF